MNNENIILGITWLAQKHYIIIFDINNKILFYSNTKSQYADDIYAEINYLFQKKHFNIKKIKYIALTYNVKSFTDIRIYYTIAYSLAQVLNVKIIDVSILNVMIQYFNTENHNSHASIVPCIFTDKKNTIYCYKKNNYILLENINKLKNNMKIIFQTDAGYIKNQKNIYLINNKLKYIKSFIKTIIDAILENKCYGKDNISPYYIETIKIKTIK